MAENDNMAALEASSETPLTAAGGGQFQKAWADTPEGEKYLSEADERQKAYDAEAEGYERDAKKAEVEGVDTAFTEAGQTGADADAIRAEDDNDSTPAADDEEVVPPVVEDDNTFVAPPVTDDVPSVTDDEVAPPVSNE